MHRAIIKTCSTLVAGMAIGALGMNALHAQQGGAIKRTLLLKQDLSIEGRESVIGHAEIPGGMESGKHTHPGEEIGYVLEGESILEIEGKPAQKLKAGDAYFIEAGRAHNARAIGTVPAKVVAVYIVEKGKPLATPAK